MTEYMKKYKLYFLQLKYVDIMTIVHNLESNLFQLKESKLLDSNQLIDYSNKLQTIITNINTIYNLQINYYLNNNDTDIDLLVNKLSDISNNNILKIINCYNTDIQCDLFSEIYHIILDIIQNYGYINLSDMISIIYPYLNNINKSINYIKNTIDILPEINNIIIPINFNIFTVNIDNGDYYWRIPSVFNENDILEKIRELWIKIPSTNINIIQYMKIDVIFKIDIFSSKTKTSQIKNPLLHKIKSNIIAKIEKNNIIDIKFVKIFISNDYLGNIYCMNFDNYIDYIVKMYNKYNKLSESTFVNIMKNFVSNDKMKHMYTTILLLLFGSEDMIDVSNLLLGLIKEKNNSNMNIYNYIVNNITYCLQLKLTKSNDNITQSMNKLKQITLDEVDYKKLVTINKNIPTNIKVHVLEKIEEMKSANNDYYKQLLYVKTILNYPWGSPNDDILYNTIRNNEAMAIEYLNNVENKLKTLSYGHVEAKKLLLQVIAKWISNPSSEGSCFGLVGPPGVGKTLLAKSVSQALDIPFAQITLGGQNDGELLHGHGYTYSGSQPGMIIKKMVEMGKSRCIIYFDELDKTCSKHGSLNEITNILIHLTDPNMNKTFQDRFFQGIDFPLDKVIMIFSYNDSSIVDPILLDRIKEIKVQPYTLEDKIHICQEHVIEEIASSVSMNKMIKINNNLLQYIIDNYTNEAGVREIKRQLENIFMNLNIDRIYKRNLFKNNAKKIILTKTKIIDILNEPDIYKRVIHNKPMIGIINGLYATASGDGGITPIQIYANTQHSNNKYEIKLTGKQGDTMKESVLCSLTVAIEWLYENNHQVDDILNDTFKNGFHVHTPDGATPKDGPSAGCAFTCGFISRLLDIPIKNNIAMTGEIDLTGKISKIGGLEFKLQGAKKAGIKTVYIPSENQTDIDMIKLKYKNLFNNDFNVISCNHINDIIPHVLQM